MNLPIPTDVIATVVYGPPGKYMCPRKVVITCEATKRAIWQGASIKEATQGNYFIDRLGSGQAVKNENGNRGVSFSRFITEEKGATPLDGNPFNVLLSNWRVKK